MPTPPEVQYRNEETRNHLASLGITHHEFVVVNDPKFSTYFEDLPTLEAPPADYAAQIAPASMRMISTPDFRVIYTNYDVGPINFPFNSFAPEMTMMDTSDETKCTDAVKRTNALNLSSAYANRFSTGLYGSITTTYVYDDGSSVTAANDLKTDSTSLLYDNIPITTVFGTVSAIGDIPKIQMEVTQPVQMVIYNPYKLKDRFNLEANQQNGRLYKFDLMQIEPHQTVSTIVFSEATYALLHVCSGSAVIGDYNVDPMNFYKYDATSPLTVTAGPEGATIIASVRVRTLGTL